MGSAQGVKTVNVNLSDFDSLADYIAGIMDYVKEYLSGTVVGDSGDGLAALLKSDNIFGNTDTGHSLHRRLRTETYPAITKELNELYQCLTDLHTNTQAIKKNYASMEDRNTASARAIDKILDATTAKTPASSTSAAAAPATPAQPAAPAQPTDDGGAPVL